MACTPSPLKYDRLDIMSGKWFEPVVSIGMVPWVVSSNPSMYGASNLLAELLAYDIKSKWYERDI